MSAADDLKKIKSDAALSEQERVWKAIEYLASQVDKTPGIASKAANLDLAKQARRLGI